MYENDLYSGAGAGSNISGGDGRDNGNDNGNENRGVNFNLVNPPQTDRSSGFDGSSQERGGLYGTQAGNPAPAGGAASGSGMGSMAGNPAGNAAGGQAGSAAGNGAGNPAQNQAGGPAYASGTGTAGGFTADGGGHNGGGNGYQYTTYRTTPDPMGEMPKTEKKEKKDRKQSGFFRKAVLSVSLGLFFGLFAGMGFYAVQQATGLLNISSAGGVVLSEVPGDGLGAEDTADRESQSGIKLTDTTSIRVVSSDVTDVVQEVMPAMVSIVNNYTEEGTTIFGQEYRQDLAASGSGIIVAESDSELLIVSNHHVVADATKLDVTFFDGTTAEAQIKGTDSDMDLAVIAIPLDSLSEETKNAIAIATLGDSDSLSLGEPVVAIGNALGYGQSVTNGIVSALDRQVSLEDGSAGTFIQTNAAINPGNSGGALLNVNGEVIGINSNKIGGSVVEGMGYAIPISAAKPIIADLMLRQTRNKVEDGQAGYIGITLQTLTEQFSQMYRMPQGIYVTGVEDGSPAQKAGLLPGDIITQFDGEKITSYEDLQSVLQYYGAGSEAVITVKRPQNGEYKELELNITLGSKPAGSQ